MAGLGPGFQSAAVLRSGAPPGMLKEMYYNKYNYYDKQAAPSPLD